MGLGLGLGLGVVHLWGQRGENQPGSTPPGLGAFGDAAPAGGGQGLTPGVPTSLGTYLPRYPAPSVPTRRGWVPREWVSVG